MEMHKNMTNLEIAKLLRSVAYAYQVKRQSPNARFRIIAYERAADSIEHATSEAKDLWDDAKLDEIPGVGEAISEYLDELFRTGSVKHFKEAVGGLPAAMFELCELPSVGPKTAYRLCQELGITKAQGALERLEKAAREGSIRKIEGFGEDSEKKVLAGLREIKARTRRMLLPYAQTIASEVIEWLKESKEVREAYPLGSLRRQVATVGDIDIAVSTLKPKEVIKHFSQYPKKTRLLEAGEATASIILPGDIQVDLMTAASSGFGALLQHFTGSKHHNIALREFALKKGMSLSEYGIKKIKNKISNIKYTNQKSRLRQGYNGQAKLLEFSREEDFYRYLGLEWIPPELREDSGEIEAALRGKLPRLISYKDIKADLQIHSDFDIETSHDLGLSSMEEIVEVANELGLEYIAFTEHNPSKSRHNEKQILDLLKKKKEKVEKLNYSLVKNGPRLRETSARQVKKVFNSLEIDILPDGNLPVSQKGLELLDFALVSIHSSFGLDRDRMTDRVLRALGSPRVKILAHPTARKLNQREGVELNWEQIFEFCLKNNKWLEINSDPARLDLPDTLVGEAIKSGVKLTMGTDSHHKDSLRNIEFGVSVARRGWATKEDIVNTRTLEEFEKLLVH